MSWYHYKSKERCLQRHYIAVLWLADELNNRSIVRECALGIGDPHSPMHPEAGMEWREVWVDEHN